MSAGAGRLVAPVSGTAVPGGSVYILVTGRADAVESPAGYASIGEERDRSQNVCP
ncbi:MAG: hypothetical protein HC882_09025 [Acidobacteria bacterium]|nr:hypothetical protein [Acidobacteriota bacterium]